MVQGSKQDQEQSGLDPKSLYFQGFFLLFERKNDRIREGEGEMNLAFTNSPPRWLQSLGLGQAEGRSQECDPFLP